MTVSQQGFSDIATPLNTALQALQRASTYLLEHIGSEDAFAAAPLYLQLCIDVAVGWMWLKMINAEPDDSRLLHARWFAEHVLPETTLLAERIEKGAWIIAQTKPENFQAW